MIKKIKEKIIGTTGSISGAASVMGSWQICHNICLGIVALLALLGITVVGMPLAFLTRLAVPFWSVAVALLLVTIILYVKKKCISKNLIMFNSGLIIAGVPFQVLQNFQIFFWVIGGVLALTATGIFIKNKIKKRLKK
jgi:hypothetical protein